MPLTYIPPFVYARDSVAFIKQKEPGFTWPWKRDNTIREIDEIYPRRSSDRTDWAYYPVSINDFKFDKATLAETRGVAEDLDWALSAHSQTGAVELYDRKGFSCGEYTPTAWVYRDLKWCPFEFMPTAAFQSQPSEEEFTDIKRVIQFCEKEDETIIRRTTAACIGSHWGLGAFGKRDNGAVGIEPFRRLNKLPAWGSTPDLAYMSLIWKHPAFTALTKATQLAVFNDWFNVGCMVVIGGKMGVLRER